MGWRKGKMCFVFLFLRKFYFASTRCDLNKLEKHNSGEDGFRILQ